ncbi:hypothetical protein OHA21_13920 [Actinoplanes sp. NBC_00393]|uniref:hypothetical protein n=1 Tax=Actinoplanes sp. NBC_00393 TaxID=2975953 RepID=UPI002E1EC463
MAEPGQRRPGMGEVWHLAASGVRHRFRLPAGRPLAWVAVVLALLIGGGLGAAAGSWVAEQTFADAPDADAGWVLHEQVAGGLGADPALADGNPTPWFTNPVSWSTLVEQRRQWDAEAARQRLAAGGWQVGAVDSRPQTGTSVDETGAATTVTFAISSFTAERDGVILQVHSQGSDQFTLVDTATRTAGNASLLPLIVLGGLAGMAGGWLVAAALLRRMRRTSPGRARSAAAVTVLAGLALAVPATAFYGNVLRAFREAGSETAVFTVHSALTPGPYWPFGPAWLNLALLGTGLVLMVAAPGWTAPAAETEAVTG